MTPQNSGDSTLFAGLSWVMAGVAILIFLAVTK
jgi:hypothetical protein